MKKTIETNEVNYKRTASALVFDRFYCKNPSAALVIAIRILTAAALSFFCMRYVFKVYDMPPTNVPFDVISMLSAVVFSLLFSYVRKRAVIPLGVFLSGVFILLKFDAFWEKFSYFVDFLILQTDGRLISATEHTLHPLEQLIRFEQYSDKYVDGVVFGCVILCVLFALVTSAGLIGKLNALPSLVFFLVLWTPVLTAERLPFEWELVPALALYAGACAVGNYYNDGLAVRHIYSSGGYRRKVKMDHRRFNGEVKSQSFGKRGAARGLYYSKYSSSLICAAAMFTALGVFFGTIFSSSAGIDYEKMFEVLQSITFGSSHRKDPFKQVSGYFSSPVTSALGSGRRLSLSAPSGRDTSETLRVTKEDKGEPLFLRGDIGMEFDGRTWSSPTASEPLEWSADGFDRKWLPVEGELFDEIITASYGDCLTDVDVGIEYLCNTDIVFVPPYIRDFSSFSSSAEDVFGDYTVRRKDDEVEGRIFGYTAVQPLCYDPQDMQDMYAFYQLLRGLNYRERSSYSANVVFEEGIIYSENSWDLYRKKYSEYYDDCLNLMNKKIGRYNPNSVGAFEMYRDYVNAHYTGVPEKIREELSEYIEGSGLTELREQAMDSFRGRFYDEDVYGRFGEIIDRYVTAKTVSDYLKNRYSYSLDAHIDSRNPVMSFLNNSKSGHCALFASSMTLILREMGIPARYVTGFVLPSEATSRVLQMKDLHAWCEVYLDEVGWVPFDPTAPADVTVADNSSGTGTGTSESSQQSGTSGDVSSEPESSDSSAQSSDTYEPSSDGNSSSDMTADGSSPSGAVITSSGDGFTFAQVLPYIVIILSAGAFVTLAVLSVKWYIRLKKRAYKRIQVFRRAENSDYVYNKLLEVLKLCGLTPQNGEQPREFFQRAEKTLGCHISEYYELFERLAFGNAELDTSERALLGRAFEKIFKASEDKHRLVGKIRLRTALLRKRV